jgi:hypothetical protein
MRKYDISVVFAICYLQNGMAQRRENNLLSISCSPVKFMRRQLGFANTVPNPLKALDKNKFELPYENVRFNQDMHS